MKEAHLLLELNILKILFFTVTTFLLAKNTLAQYPTTPSDYYQFPIMPGNQAFLSGTMGELRSTHFHAGIDIKTKSMEGFKVYAAADGHVSRVKLATGGYGHSLYLKHTNGTTTVYAHLKEFREDIGKYILYEQYQKQSYKVDIFPKGNKFPIKKGDLIGWSGNTGSSHGPHLHFEIRDLNQNVLNPIKFNFKEVIDDTPPTIQKIALVTQGEEARIEGVLGRFEFSPNRDMNLPIKALGNIGIEIKDFDRVNGSSNKNGVVKKILKVNGEVVFYQNIESFSFNEARNILVHINYREKQREGETFSKLYIDTGNKLRFYQSNESNGLIAIEPEQEYKIEVELYDSYENVSTLSFKIVGEKAQLMVKPNKDLLADENKPDIWGHLLLIRSTKADTSSIVKVFIGKKEYPLPPSYITQRQATFIWSLTRGLPDKIHTPNGKLYYNFISKIHPGKRNHVFNDIIEISFAPNALFDTLYLQARYTQNSNYTETFSINDQTIPIKSSIEITLKPSQFYEDKYHTHAYSIDSQGEYLFIGGDWSQNRLTFQARKLGDFTILRDSKPPVVTPIKESFEEMKFRIVDDLSGISTATAKINGEWLLMAYEPKQDMIWSKTRNGEILKGKFELEVRDRAGNVSLYNKNLK